MVVLVLLDESFLEALSFLTFSFVGVGSVSIGVRLLVATSVVRMASLVELLALVVASLFLHFNNLNNTSTNHSKRDSIAVIVDMDKDKWIW